MQFWKKLFGTCRRLYIHKPVKGTARKMERLYTPGILCDTGIDARSMPIFAWYAPP